MSIKRGFKGWFTALRERLPPSRQQHESVAAEMRARFDYLNLQITHLNGLFAHAFEKIAVRDYLLALPMPATSAMITELIPLTVRSAREVCLFVTHAPEARLKPHVLDHVSALLDQHVAVVLVVNTDLEPAQFELPDFASRLSGCFVRENLGFDFAAWAHAYALANPPLSCERLYLINDSIVGPLDLDAYAQLLDRIRAISADLVGITSNPVPEPHLQSYYLVVNRRLLLSPVFDRLMRGIVNFPSKASVIAQYETQLTRFIAANGFTFESLFEMPPDRGYWTDPTMHDWSQLIECGFPFVKSHVMNALRESPQMIKAVPDRYRRRSN